MACCGRSTSSSRTGAAAPPAVSTSELRAPAATCLEPAARLPLTGGGPPWRRLDMSKRLANCRGRDLYAFWRERITQSLARCAEHPARCRLFRRRRGAPSIWLTLQGARGATRGEPLCGRLRLAGVLQGRRPRRPGRASLHTGLPRACGVCQAGPRQRRALCSRDLRALACRLPALHRWAPAPPACACRGLHAPARRPARRGWRQGAAANGHSRRRAPPSTRSCFCAQRARRARPAQSPRPPLQTSALPVRTAASPDQAGRLPSTGAQPGRRARPAGPPPQPSALPTRTAASLDQAGWPPSGNGGAEGCLLLRRFVIFYGLLPWQHALTSEPAIAAAYSWRAAARSVPGLFAFEQASSVRRVAKHAAPWQLHGTRHTAEVRPSDITRDHWSCAQLALCRHVLITHKGRLDTCLQRAGPLMVCRAALGVHVSARRRAHPYRHPWQPASSPQRRPLHDGVCRGRNTRPEVCALLGHGACDGGACRPRTGRHRRASAGRCTASSQ